MKNSKLILFTLISTLSFFTQHALAEELKYIEDPDGTLQKAILNEDSNICHAKTSHHYKSLAVKIEAANAPGALPGVKAAASYLKDFPTLNECVVKGKGKVDKRYAKRFPVLAVQNIDSLIAEKKEELEIEPDQNERKKILKDIEYFEYIKDSQVETAIEAENKKDKETKATNDFYGFNWAPAIGIMHYGSKSYIKDVRIESEGEGADMKNVIYIDSQIETNLAVLLETHYLEDFGGTVGGRKVGHGFFAAMNVAKQEGDPLSTFALGYMYAVKDKEGANGISIGIGGFIDTDFKVLRDGLTDGSETQYTDTIKAVRKVDAYGLMIMVSAKF